MDIERKWLLQSMRFFYFQIYKKIYKEFHAVQSALLRNNVGKFSNFDSRSDNVRYFNTTCSNRSDKRSSKDSDSENPDKKPDQSEEMRLLLRKLSMLIMILCFLLVVFRRQPDTDVEVSGSRAIVYRKYIENLRYRCIPMSDIQIVFSFCLLE